MNLLPAQHRAPSGAPFSGVVIPAAGCSPWRLETELVGGFCVTKSFRPGAQPLVGTLLALTVSGPVLTRNSDSDACQRPHLESVSASISFSLCG